MYSEIRVVETEKVMSKKLNGNSQSLFTVEEAVQPALTTDVRNDRDNKKYQYFPLSLLIEIVSLYWRRLKKDLDPYVTWSWWYLILCTHCAEVINCKRCYLVTEWKMGSVLREWKRTNVLLIFKKSGRKNMLNCKPVLLLSIVCETLEKIIIKQGVNICRNYLGDS